MSRFARKIRPFVDQELAAAARSPDPATRQSHLERAHVLGQASTREHVRVHLQMLVTAWHRRDAREIAGQALRVVGAAAFTGLGWIPEGNTGGSNVSAFRPMAIPTDLALLIARARAHGQR